MQPLSIALVEQDELNTLATLGRKTFSEAFADQNNPADFQHYLDTAFDLNTIAETWGNPNTFYYFARLGQEIVGYLKLNIDTAQSEPMGTETLEVERIYILQTHQGKGLGRILLDWSVNQAKRHNKKRVWLGVWEKNPRAIAFYQRFGFQPFDSHIYMVGQDEQTDIMLELLLE